MRASSQSAGAGKPASGAPALALPAHGWTLVAAIAGAAALVVMSALSGDRAVRYLGIHAGVLGLWLLLFARRFPRVVTVIWALAAILNGAGWAYRWLDVVPHYDALAHGFVTFALTLPATMSVHEGVDRTSTRRARWAFLLATLGIGLGAGAAWELYEWTADHFVVPPFTMRIADTISDLMADYAGALLAAPVAHRLLATWPKRGRR